MTTKKTTVPADWHKVLYFLTKTQVSKVTGYSCKHLEDLVSQGSFPAPVRLAERCAPRWSSLAVAKALGEKA